METQTAAVDEWCEQFLPARDKLEGESVALERAIGALKLQFVAVLALCKESGLELPRFTPLSELIEREEQLVAGEEALETREKLLQTAQKMYELAAEGLIATRFELQQARAVVSQDNEKLERDREELTRASDDLEARKANARGEIQAWFEERLTGLNELIEEAQSRKPDEAKEEHANGALFQDRARRLIEKFGFEPVGGI